MVFFSLLSIFCEYGVLFEIVLFRFGGGKVIKLVKIIKKINYFIKF